MAIVQGDTIDKDDIISAFHTAVKDFITSQTLWIASTVIGNQSLAAITGSTVETTAAPGSVIASNLSEMIGADTPTVGHVTNVLKSFMNVYSKNQRIYIYNTSRYISSLNYGYAPYDITGVARLTTNSGINAEGIYQVVEPQVAADFDSAKSVRAINTGTLITASTLNSLIADCKQIWINRCQTPSVKLYHYSYCHSNHSNHSSHGSRGRR